MYYFKVLTDCRNEDYKWVCPKTGEVVGAGVTHRNYPDCYDSKLVQVLMYGDDNPDDKVDWDYCVVAIKDEGYANFVREDSSFIELTETEVLEFGEKNLRRFVSVTHPKALEVVLDKIVAGDVLTDVDLEIIDKKNPRPGINETPEFSTFFNKFKIDNGE